MAESFPLEPSLWASTARCGAGCRCRSQL